MVIWGMAYCCFTHIAGCVILLDPYCIDINAGFVEKEPVMQQAGSASTKKEEKKGCRSKDDKDDKDSSQAALLHQAAIKKLCAEMSR